MIELSFISEFPFQADSEVLYRRGRGNGASATVILFCVGSLQMERVGGTRFTTFNVVESKPLQFQTRAGLWVSRCIVGRGLQT